VNLDLDLRLHRDAARCPATSVRGRWAVPADVEENDLPERT
jgi:hypothetical protein